MMPSIMNSGDAIQRLREVLRRQHKAISTEVAYVFWLKQYIASLRDSPDSLSVEQKVEHFLTLLACQRNVSASTQNQALNAIVFFYKEVRRHSIQGLDALRAHRPQRLRHAPTIPETQALLHSVQDLHGYPTNLIARLLYGCGLRVSEPLNLRIKDVQLQRSRLFIRGAKFGKDRVVSLPTSLAAELNQQFDSARTVWLSDQRNKIPVVLPYQLATKYPECQFAWPWAWLFPSRHPCRHPRTGAVVRYRMHVANVQRAIKAARRKLGISVLPHELRHGYATHCLEQGANPRAIQAAMGHNSLETTMGYLHADSLSVRSPLETTLGSSPMNAPALDSSDKASGLASLPAKGATSRSA